jgi:hypothetical protein
MDMIGATAIPASFVPLPVSVVNQIIDGEAIVQDEYAAPRWASASERAVCADLFVLAVKDGVRLRCTAGIPAFGAPPLD